MNNGDNVDRAAPDPLSMRELVSGLRRHVPIVFLVAAVGAAVALAVALLQPPRYTATASVVVEAADATTAVSTVNMATEKRVASSTTVAEAVIRDLHIHGTADEVLSGLSLTIPVDTDVLVFSYTSTDARSAEHRAQAFADAYLTYRRETITQSIDTSNEAIRARIQGLRGALQTLTARAATESDPGKRAAYEASTNSLLAQISIQEQALASRAGQLATVGRVLESASVPADRTEPRVVVNGLVGLFLGLVMGTFLAIGRASWAARILTERDAEQALGSAVLATIPLRRARRKSPPLAVQQRDPATLQAFRRLVVDLSSMLGMTRDRSTSARTIAVVALDAGADSSMLVANLGAAMALAGKEVIVVAASADEPRLASILGVPPAPAIVDVIRFGKPLSDAIHPTTFPALRVVPTGSAADDWALLDTDGVRTIMTQLASTADVVLVDAPSGTADGAVVAASDVSLFVGSLRSTSSHAALRTRAQMELLGIPTLGVVLFERSRRSTTRRRADRSDGAPSAPALRPMMPADAADPITRQSR